MLRKLFKRNETAGKGKTDLEEMPDIKDNTPSVKEIPSLKLNVGFSEFSALRSPSKQSSLTPQSKDQDTLSPVKILPSNSKMPHDTPKYDLPSATELEQGELKSAKIVRFTSDCHDPPQSLNELPKSLTDVQQTLTDVPHSKNSLPKSLNDFPGSLTDKYLSRAPISLTEASKSITVMPNSLTELPQSLNEVPREDPPRSLNELPVNGNTCTKSLNDVPKSHNQLPVTNGPQSLPEVLNRKREIRLLPPRHLGMQIITRDKSRSLPTGSPFLGHHTSIDLMSSNTLRAQSSPGKKDADPNEIDLDYETPKTEGPLDTEQQHLAMFNKTLIPEAYCSGKWVIPANVKRSGWRAAGLVLAYQIALIAISFITAICANNYSQSEVINGYAYNLWGHYLLDGIINAVFIGFAFREMIKAEQKSNNDVNYRNLYWIILLTTIIGALVSVGFNSRFEQQPQKMWFYLISKLVVLPFVGLIYSIYLRTKKLYQLKKCQTEKGMFFKSNIYRNFLEELNHNRIELKDKQRTSKQSIDSQGRHTKSFDTQIFDHRYFQELSYKLKFNKMRYLKVLPIRRGIALLLVIAGLFIQLFASYSYLKAVDYAYESQNISYLYIASVIYPTVIGIIKFFVMKVNTAGGSPMAESNIQLISMLFAVLPYRLVFLRSRSYAQALGIIGIKFGYKFVVYFLYGGNLALLHQIGSKISHGWQNAKSKFRKVLTNKGGTSKVGQTEAHSVILRLKSHKDAVLQESHLKDLICRFLMLQMIDITNLIAFVITFVAFSLQKAIPHIYQKFCLASVKRLVGSNMIELGLDLLILVLVLGLLWYKRHVLKPVVVKNYIVEFVHESYGLMIAASLIIYFSQQLIISNLWSEYIKETILIDKSMVTLDNI